MFTISELDEHIKKLCCE
uniref:Uncharacterized protein n=1 Tax=Nymphaea colorata TaxID=210225 RepID=A0A5K1D176_9MAGN